MKKYLAFFLLLSVTALVYGRPQKLVIKTDKESVELRYWPLDGKQLPFYSLYSPVIVTCRQMTEIELPCNETIYKISLGKGKNFIGLCNCRGCGYSFLISGQRLFQWA